VEDIYPEGGGIPLDRGGSVHWLEGVRELEDEMYKFGEVLYLAWGRGRGGCPAVVSAIARLNVSMSCRRATVSWPVISVKRGDRIFTLRPGTAGAEAARRNWTFCWRNLARREGEEAAEEGAGPADRSSRWCEASWYMRSTATQEVGIARRISWKLEVRSTGRGWCRWSMVLSGGGCGWRSLSNASGGRVLGRLLYF
jgi:hypothetical protein